MVDIGYTRAAFKLELKVRGLQGLGLGVGLDHVTE